MNKAQLLAAITRAAKPLGWSAVEIQQLSCLKKPLLEKLLAVFSNGTKREDRINTRSQ